jgi:low affinity Fe/Cu permease
MSGIIQTLDTFKQLNEIGMTVHITVAMMAIVIVISFIISAYKLYKDIDRRIDERIDERIKPSLDLLKETVVVVKSLERTTAEMNGTLTILKDILIGHKS